MENQKNRLKKIYLDWNIKDDENNLTIYRPTVFGKGNRGNIYNLISQIKKGPL